MVSNNETIIDFILFIIQPNIVRIFESVNFGTKRIGVTSRDTRPNEIRTKLQQKDKHKSVSSGKNSAERYENISKSCTKYDISVR